MAYGAYTKVPLDRTMNEIVALLKKAGAYRIAQVEDQGQVAVQCFVRDRMLRFAVSLPDSPQGARQRGRALLLVIKAKLESVESEVESFDEAFLANIVTPGGPTVADWLIPQIEEGYKLGKMPTQLLLADNRESERTGA
jgi:hypothetical protein